MAPRPVDPTQNPLLINPLVDLYVHTGHEPPSGPPEYDYVPHMDLLDPLPPDSPTEAEAWAALNAAAQTAADADTSIDSTQMFEMAMMPIPEEIEESYEAESPVLGAVGGSDPSAIFIGSDECMPYVLARQQEAAELEVVDASSPIASRGRTARPRRLFADDPDTSGIANNDPSFLFSPGPNDNPTDRSFPQLDDLLEQAETLHISDADIPWLHVEDNSSIAVGNTPRSADPVQNHSLSQPSLSPQQPCVCFDYQQTGTCDCQETSV